jgi:hypothetical protein
MTALRLRSVRLLATAMLLALVAALVPQIAHADTDDVTWTVRTDSNAFGASRTSYSYVLDPGATLQDGLVIANRGTTPLDLGVYAADGFTTEDGQLDVLTAGETSKAVGVWVAASGDHVTVDAGQTVTVPFTVTIPQNATPGDYAGGIVTSLKSTGASGVDVDRRLGIRVMVRVGGALAPSMAIEGVHVDWSGGLNPFAGGDATVTYTLHNTGNAVLGAQQSASVAGVFGWFPTDAAPLDPSPQLLPGETWNETVTVPGIAPLVWLLATATVTPIVVDASGSTTSLAPVVATGSGWAVPWMLLIILVVVAAVVVAAILLSRRRRTAAKAREDARVAAAVAEALQEKEDARV